MAQWTDKQEAAILARGASVVVSAAAGSGKTSVLVERLIRLLSDESQAYPAEKMIVVTFTNDAAGEVRKRLNQALTKKIGTDPDNEWLRRQQTMLHSAKISTIHGFCFDLLREHFSVLDIPSSFRIMEPKEEEELRTAAAAEVLEDFFQRAETDPDTAADRKLLLDAFCGRDDSMLDALLLKIYDLETETPFGEHLTDDAAAACENGTMQQRMLDALQTDTDEIMQLYSAAKEIAQQIGEAKVFAVLESEADRVCRIRDAVKDGGFLRICDALNSFKKDRLTFPKNCSAPEQCGSIKALRNHAAKLVEDMKETWAVPLQYAEADLKKHAAILHALTGLLRAFTEVLTAKKQERGALGFSDAITMALSLLAVREPDGSITKTALAEQLSEQYVCIMIDEFQDADNQQDLIFRMLSRGGSAEHYGSNLFVVGDSKQCIYRFRNANPENFYNAMREGAEYEGPMLTQNTCIRLNRNFRSAQEVVDTVNIVFSMLMTKEIGEIDYDETQQLVRGADYPEAVRRTEIIPYQPDASDKKNTEPLLAAERIAWHLANQTPVLDKDGTRPCEPRDFLLLMRNSTHMPLYAAALKERRIPVCSIDQKGYLDAPELRLLLDLLRAVDNPLPEIPLTAAMLSPLFGFTLDEILTLRLTSRKSKLFSAMNDLRKAAEEGTAQPDPELLRKCCSLLDFLESMRLLSAIETPEQLIRHIYEQTDFLGMMQMTAGGAQKKANLRALLTHAAGFEETHGGGLSAFLRYIDAIKERGSDLKGGGVPAGTENAVRIKTIHSSKGLEAPFVIFADSSCSFSRREQDEEKLIRFHSDLGIGFQIHDPDTFTTGRTAVWVTIDRQNRREQFSEELRLLYVALTRAREYLILPIPYSLPKSGSPYQELAAEQAACGQTDTLTRSAKSYRDFLMMALIRNPACELLRRELEVQTDSDPQQPFLPAVILTDIEETVSEEEAEQDTPIAADPALTALLTEQCRFVYESKEAHLTAKYGVSELAKEDDFSVSLRNPLFVREKHGLSGAERGTAIHTFMQYADFEAAAKDISQEAERLRTEGRLTARQKQAVEKSSLAQFFTSELYDRIRKSSDIRREQKFTVRLRDLRLSGKLAHLGADYENTDGMLIGIMDLVFAEDDGIVLVDYKTDRVKSSEELLEAYTEQIRLYAEALRLLTGAPVKACFLYSVTLNRTVPVTL